MQTRAQWGAKAPKKHTKLTSFTSGWFVHWLGPAPATANDGIAAEQALMRSIQDFHMRPKSEGGKGWNDFAYSFGVGQSGTVYEGRGWGIAGGHTQGHNSTGMAIVFLIGKGQIPTGEALASAAALIADGKALGYSAKLVRPHHAVAKTECPGPHLTAWVNDLDITGPARVVSSIGSSQPATSPALRLQTYLRSAPEGAWFGDAGPNKDGVDGVLGDLTVNAALWLMEERKVRIRLLEDQLLSGQPVVDLSGLRAVFDDAIATIRHLLDDIDAQGQP